MLSKLSGINAINKKNTISHSLSDIASANKHKMSLRELIIIALSLNAAKKPAATFTSCKFGVQTKTKSLPV